MPDEDFSCPNCGADVPAKAKACPECGADEKTGWSDDRVYDGTGIDEPEEFNYEAWKLKELGGGPQRSGREWIVWVVATLLLVLMIWWLVLGR